MVDKQINPFINSLTVPYIEYVKKFKVIEGNAEIIEKFDVEKTEYFRVYKTKKYRDFIYQQLSMYARDLYTAIQYFTNHDYRYVIITYKKMSELMGEDKIYTERRFNEILRELVSMSVIDTKCKKNGEYWYNPSYFSPTNRVKLFPECAIKTNTIILSGARQD